MVTFARNIVPGKIFTLNIPKMTIEESIMRTCLFEQTNAMYRGKFRTYFALLFFETNVFTSFGISRSDSVLANILKTSRNPSAFFLLSNRRI